MQIHIQKIEKMFHDNVFEQKRVIVDVGVAESVDYAIACICIRFVESRSPEGLFGRRQINAIFECYFRAQVFWRTDRLPLLIYIV